jgi:hypothetical protein
MSKWSESAELLQRLITAKEVIPIQSDLISLQQAMFALQAEQMKLVDENAKLKEENQQLKKRKKYIYEPGHKWMIDSGKPDIKLCPTCLNRDGFESPLGNLSYNHRYCGNCKSNLP